MKKIIIAIDGFAACGKSTTAKLVAKRLGYGYIDTGAMYRAVTLYFLDNQIDWLNKEAVSAALEQINIRFAQNSDTQTNDVFLNGKNIEQDIRTMRITGKVSQVSAISEVRRFLVAQQQDMGSEKGIVMDGRDIGTVVFPDAALKAFMTADMVARAKRRLQELNSRGKTVELQDVIDDLGNRDRIDSTREDSPLKKAHDAHTIDTSNITIQQQVNQILELARKIIVSD
ncbi:MAG: cytidylate kinase [Arenicella sp.]|jgi:cytidylate kinase